MSFRAIVQDGLIVINTHGRLPDGTLVRVIAEAPATRGARPRPGSSRRSSGARKPVNSKLKPLNELPAFGMWKGRLDWKGKTTKEIARELRKKSLGRNSRRRG